MNLGRTVRIRLGRDRFECIEKSDRILLPSIVEYQIEFEPIRQLSLGNRSSQLGPGIAARSSRSSIGPCNGTSGHEAREVRLSSSGLPLIPT